MKLKRENLFNDELSRGHFVLFKDPQYVNPLVQIGEAQFCTQDSGFQYPRAQNIKDQYVFWGILGCADIYFSIGDRIGIEFKPVNITHSLGPLSKGERRNKKEYNDVKVLHSKVYTPKILILLFGNYNYSINCKNLAKK